VLTHTSQEESFFDMLLGLCGVVHALYMFVLVICILSYAIFFGITGGFIMTIVGALILPVAWLASRPDDGEGSVSLP
jgi:thiosulfate reductase cytochrome b subunit